MCTMDFKGRGNEAFKQGNYHSAIELYTEALRVDSQNAVLYSNRAMCLSKLNQWEKVVEDCSKGLQLDPADKTRVKLLYRRGGAYAELGSILAEGDLLAALKMDPGNTSVREVLNSLKGENKLKKQKRGVIPLQILQVEYLPGEEAEEQSEEQSEEAEEQFEEQSEEAHEQSEQSEEAHEQSEQPKQSEGSGGQVSHFSQCQNSSPYHSDSLSLEPSIYNLTNMHRCAGAERVAAYRYILDVLPSRYSEIFRDGGLEPEFMNFFFDAVLYTKEARLGGSILDALSKCDRFQLTLLLCDSVKLNRVNAFMQVDA